jgi:hypothetical protein
MASAPKSLPESMWMYTVLISPILGPSDSDEAALSPPELSIDHPFISLPEPDEPDLRHQLISVINANIPFGA